MKLIQCLTIVIVASVIPLPGFGQVGVNGEIRHPSTKASEVNLLKPRVNVTKTIHRPVPNDFRELKLYIESLQERIDALEKRIEKLEGK